jgi:hypothetical protein
MKPETIELYVDAAADVIGLPIPADCRSGVIANFQRIAALAETVTSFELPLEVESAPVFSHAKR